MMGVRIPLFGAYRQTLIMNGEVVRDEVVELPTWVMDADVLEFAEEPEADRGD